MLSNIIRLMLINRDIKKEEKLALFITQKIPVDIFGMITHWRGHCMGGSSLYCEDCKKKRECAAIFGFLFTKHGMKRKKIKI